MRRIIAFLLLLTCVTVMPVSAQEASLLDWIPADFAGFIRVDMSDPGQTLQSLNVGAFAASMLQPTRVSLERALTFDDVFPLTALDVENISFNSSVLPWLGDELILAYRSMPPNYVVSAEDVLLILSTDDPFNAINGLSTIIQGQDLLEETTYRGVTIYRGDQIALAATPLAVLIGAEEAIHAALDTEAGETPALTGEANYQAARAAIPGEPSIFAYFHGEAAAGGLAYVLGGAEDAGLLLGAVGEAARSLQQVESVETALLAGEIDAVAIGLRLDTLITNEVGARIVFHTPTEGLIEADAAFDTSLLDLIPRSALMVQSGSDAHNAVYTSLAALPMANFAARVLGGFPIAPAAMPEDAVVPIPTAGDIENAVNSFASALESVHQLDLIADVLDQAQGSYAFALLPRPNNPLPVLNTPFDALLVLEAQDAGAVLEGIDTLLQTFVVDGDFESVTYGGYDFTTLATVDTDEAILSMGAVDDLFLIATGDAVELALAAQRGDNRLISQARWLDLSREITPSLYVDIPGVYNTFFPTAGGQQGSFVRQIGVESRTLGEGFYEIRMEVMLDPDG